ncbi:MAG TPA: SDR family NAD(P)-dependent oxidoreductase [Thermoanaerobaculia bacterium]|jgi:acyl transferase domain-containing protein|nr:SDR family NAD(P)-dependent oxidoreductase [Thermoanaerobaculia bacterium]
MSESNSEFNGNEIAIIGMSCRFPGAAGVEQFWRNLAGGVESLTLLTDEDLARAGVDPQVYNHPNYVRRASVLDGVELFDPAFFGYTPLEAKLMDPQHRLFLECAWEVFEQAGYDPESYPAPVGVFTGAKTNTYLFSLFSNRELFRSLDTFQIALGNDLASMATRVSYKLNLRGPSYALHTACSTSLVAVHLACQSLLLDECRMAVAGGAAVNVPHRKGYVYQKGGILSTDGSCRTFDEKADGSNFGNGVGAVLLKRLEDALADGDPVFAVIRGSATNNDGSRKASYTAPGVEGQTAVLLEAMACAGVDPGDLSFIETHGTATDLGDSIEMLALAEAFRAGVDPGRRHFCALGSVKTNIGHLETAAGIAGLIKTALALQHRQMPPSLHFTRPNPKIDFENSPFYVNTELAEWRTDGRPRRAGLSSFGIGSTNAHVILEEAPEAAATTPPSRPLQLLVLSARTETALDAMTENLARHLEENPEVTLADVAWTLHVGRKGFQHRRAIVCNPDGAVAALRAARESDEAADRSVVFLFPGLGEQSVDMGLGLYQTEPAFRAALDRCAELLRPELGIDLRELLYPRGMDAAETVGADPKRLFGRAPVADDPASRRLQETRYAQPALFAVEYALAKLWMEWGIRPRAMVGYSVGEYVAACLSGVLSLEDALKLVARRARMIQELPAGSMTAVPLPEDEIAPLLARHGLSLAALNGPAVSVAAGPEEAVAALERELEEGGTVCRRLPTTHAFHSSMMEPLAGALTELARTVERKAPKIPYLSNVTGTWITDGEAQDPGYWARHMRGTVRFADGLRELLTDGTERIFLEVGPGQSLGSFTRLHPDCGKEKGRRVVASMRTAHGGPPSQEVLLAALGRLWAMGMPVDWKTFHAGEKRRRVPLPTYPFERQAYWVEPDGIPQTPARAGVARIPDVRDWFYLPVWRRTEAPAASDVEKGAAWLLLGEGGEMARELVRKGADVVLARFGSAFGRDADGAYLVRPGEPDDYAALFDDLARRRKSLRRVVHLGALSARGEAGFQRSQETGFYSLVSLVQALGRQGFSGPLRIDVVTGLVQSVTGEEDLNAEMATLLGACLVVPQEQPNLVCRAIDLDLSRESPAHLLAELLADAPEPAVAYRGGERWIQAFDKLPLAGDDQPIFREQGVYLITGGAGGIGMILARHLARTARARLVLTRRSPLEEGRDSRLIARVRELEALGAEVEVVGADVADEAAMRQLVAHILERFGALHGVIHAAGVLGPDVFKPLVRSTRESSELHFRPKAHGLYALERALAGVEIDFCLLYSSISAVLGGLGNIAYAAANRFMDAFAQRHNRAGGAPWISVDWDSWVHETPETPEGNKGGIGTILEELAATPEEGVESVRRVLASGRRHLVMSTGDLQARLAQWVPRKTLAAAAEPTTGVRTRRESGPRPAGDELERRLAAIWKRHLGVDAGPEENFFDLGGNSLLGLQVIADVNRELGVEVTPVALFESPTVRALARQLSPEPQADPERRQARRQAVGERDIAILSMAGRFPGARDIDQFWENLRAGRETISFFTDEELIAAGTDPELLRDPNYVRARPVLDDVERFDAAFFGYTPRDAELMDPQHRVFLECAWEALEQAGYDSERFGGRVGVYAGGSISAYMANIYSNPELVESVGTFPILIGNEKDAITTKVSYKMNLRGPSLAVQTFCSTSLVAVHLACQALANGECEMALAGGISIILPQVSGYLFQEGGIGSRDGHIRAFDAGASGIVFGNGVGIVMLKRLSEALADGDPILAVIKGTAINNDGSVKAGYTATSVAGQSDVVSDVLEMTGIDPETIGYMEAHGTGTPLGDPIEMAALTRAFRSYTGRRKFCPIGSVKTNVGHLDRAAGVSGLIKTVLALQHKEIPPSLYFETPNPNIDFEDCPFFVNTELREWPSDGRPRRAGVNSLGLGGTNAHALLEEAPEIEPSSPSRPWQLVVLSAQTETALESATDRLAARFEDDSELNFADASYTLQVGRKGMTHRRIVVASSAADAAAALASRDPRRLLSATWEPKVRPVVFLFPGLGGQYPGMARGLYESEPVFRAEVDRCAEILQPLLGLDIREVIYPPQATPEAAGGLDLRRMLSRGNTQDEATKRLNETWLTQPAVFVIEMALAKLWMEWGIRPQAVLGYSVGEYAAACVAGILSLEDALELVAKRARMIEDLPAGSMLAVPLSEEEVLPLLGDDLSLAGVNGPEQSVVAGTPEAVARFAASLEEKGIVCRQLQTSHAFHSRMMDPLFEPVTELARGLSLQAPRIPILSNVTGTWLTAGEAADPAYWARHMCGTVRFSTAARALLADPNQVFLELGPGQTLGSLLLQQAESEQQPLVVSALRHSYESHPDQAFLLQALGRLWLAGVEPDWSGFYAGERRLRVRLPPYPFERQKFWIEAGEGGYSKNRRLYPKKRDVGEWFYAPTWKRSVPPRVEIGEGSWLVFADGSGVAEALAERLPGAVLVEPGDSFARLDGGRFRIAKEGYSALFEALGGVPERIVHLWSLDLEPSESFASVLALGRAIAGSEPASPVSLWVAASELHEVSGEEEGGPERAVLLGACEMLPREVPSLACRVVDLPAGRADRLARQLLAELVAAPDERRVAWRGPHRWVPAVEPSPLPPAAEPAREGGVYLVAGGLDGPGAAFARHLSKRAGAKLVLLDPAGSPAREEGESQILVTGIDLADETQVLSALAFAEERFGALHGAVYAGHAGEDLGAQARAPRVLDRLLGGRALDFALLVSAPSESAMSAAVAASGCLLEAFGEREGAWTSVTWDVDEGEEAADEALRRLFAGPPASRIIVSPGLVAERWNRLAVAVSERPAKALGGAGYYTRPDLGVEFVAPRNELEENLAQVWRDLLGVGQLGIHDSFLDLGGDSLLAARLAARMRDTLGVELPVRLFFERPTVAELAEAVEELRRDAIDEEMRALMSQVEDLSESELELEIQRMQSLLGEEEEEEVANG